MRLTFLIHLVVLIAFVFLPSLSFARQAPLTRIRPLHPVLAETLEIGQQWSPTVRALFDDLQRSDVIVHIVPQRNRCWPAGTLQFVATRAGYRFVRVSLDVSLSVADRVSLLARERQHVSEVAQQPGVTDVASFEELFRRIGRPVRHGSHAAYETDQARNVGLAAHREVSALSVSHATFWRGANPQARRADR